MNNINTTIRKMLSLNKGRSTILVGLLVYFVAALVSPLGSELTGSALAAGNNSANVHFVNYGTVTVTHNYTGNGLETEQGTYKLFAKDGDDVGSSLYYSLDGKDPQVDTTKTNTCVPYVSIGATKAGLPTGTPTLVLKKNFGTGSSNCETQRAANVTIDNLSDGSLTMFNWVNDKRLTPVAPVLPYFAVLNNKSDRSKFRSFPDFIKADDGSFIAAETQGCKSYLDGVTKESGKVHLWNRNSGTACPDAYKVSNYAVKFGNRDNYKVNGTDDDGSPSVSGSTGAQPDASKDSETIGLECHAGINPLNWLLCGAVKGMVNIVGALDRLINSELSIGSDGNTDDPSQIFGDSTDAGQYNISAASGADAKTTQNSFYQAWKGVRNLALGLIVIAGLIVVIAQVLGTELVDAYTFKKILPRILIAALGITLSWQLLQFFVKLTNDLGFGVRFLIYQPFTGLENVITGGTGGNIAVNILGLGALAALGIFGLLSFAATAALAVFVAFILLVLRQIVVIVLIILAPIAIVAYILPNTQNIYKLWWESLSKALLVFPIIAAFIAAGRVFSLVSIQGTPSALNQFIGFAAYFAPYFLLPAAFKLAGGTLGRLAGSVNDRSRGGFDRIKNFRNNTQKRRATNAINRAQTGRVFKQAPAGSVRSRLNTGVQSAALLNKAGMRPRRIVSNIRGARTTSDMQQMLEGSEKNEQYRTVKGNDDWLAAATHGRGTDADARAYLKDRGQSGPELERGVSLIRQAKNSMGERAFATAAAVDNAATGTGYAGGTGEMLSAIANASGGDMALAGSMLAMAKGKAEGARRYDLSGAGFGDMYGQMNNINNAKSPTESAAAIQNASDYLTDKALDANGPGAMLAGRGQSVKNLVPAMQRRVRRASDAVKAAPVGSEERNNAERQYKQVLASTAGLLDVSAQVSPENARMLANGLLSANVATAEDGKPITLGQQIEANRGDREFMEMRREMGQSSTNEFASAQARAAQAQAQQRGGFNMPGPTLPGPTL